MEEYSLTNGRRVNILGDGRLINLAAAEGHPSVVMDMSFANQSLAAEYISNNYQNFDKKVYMLPTEVDMEIARLKLESMKVAIDTLTEEQIKYLASFEMGLEKVHLPYICVKKRERTTGASGVLSLFVCIA